MELNYFLNNVDSNYYDNFIKNQNNIISNLYIDIDRLSQIANNKYHEKQFELANMYYLEIKNKKDEIIYIEKLIERINIIKQSENINNLIKLFNKTNIET
jgi:hypothetical protein